MLSLDTIVQRLGGKREGPQYKAKCPAHADHKASLAITLADHGGILLHCHAGCATADVLAAGGFTWPDIQPEKNGSGPRMVEAYDYRDLSDTLLYQNVRYEPKSFRMRKPDGQGGWTWKLGDVSRVLYRLPEIQGADTVWFVEGEKDANRLASLGLVSTSMAGGANAWKAAFAKQLADANVRRVLIIPDNDEPGRQLARKVLAACLSKSLVAEIVELEGDGIKDASNYFDAGHTRADLEARVGRRSSVQVVDSSLSFPRSLSMADAYRVSSLTVQKAVTQWGLSTNARMEPLHSLENLRLAVEHDPVFIGRVWYDAFLDKMLTGDPVREWRDEDDVGAAMYFQSRLQLPKVTPKQMQDVLDYVCRLSPHHAVRDWLGTLTWDGRARLETAFETYWGVTDIQSHPLDYVRAASRNFFLGLVARVMRPGCKLDTMPVFEGGQGTFKSTALDALAWPWFATTHETMGTKDFLIGIRGKWLIEISELHALSRAEVAQAKQTMSTRIDTYRTPWGRRAQDFPRQCVFAGTTNADMWGTDETGLRRFWPIRCGRIDVDGLRAIRELLFAEAVAAYRAGATWWEMPDSARDVQGTRMTTDALTESVRMAVVGLNETSVADICRALKLPPEKMDRSLQMRIADSLRRLGWERRIVWKEGKTCRSWFAPDLLLDGSFSV